MGTSKPNETRGNQGLSITGIEDVESSRLVSVSIYDAEGVRVRAKDEIEIAAHGTEPRSFARVLEVRELQGCDEVVHRGVVVVWRECGAVRVGEIDPETFENFCRIQPAEARASRR